MPGLIQVERNNTAKCAMMCLRKCVVLRVSLCGAEVQCIQKVAMHL
jgi:hypothetical protein